MGKSKYSSMGKTALFTALMCMCSWLAVPSPVPFTMQNFGVLLTAAVLGGRGAATAVLVYIGLGILGLPVFSGGRAGIGILFGATGGYIIGFLPCSYIAGKLCERTKKRPYATGFFMAVGLLCEYIFGVLWFWLVYLKGQGFWTAVTTGIVPFVATDGVKIALASLIATKLQKIE